MSAGHLSLIAIVENNTAHYTYSDHPDSSLAVTNGSCNIDVEANSDIWADEKALMDGAVPTKGKNLANWLYIGYWPIAFESVVLINIDATWSTGGY